MRVAFNRLDVMITSMGHAPAEVSRVLVCWEIVPIHNGLDQARFRLERALSPAFGPDDDVTLLQDNIPGVVGQTVYTYEDVTPSLINLWRLYWYRVTATYAPDVTVSKVHTWEKSPRTYELAIIERHDLLLQEFTGSPCFAFIERTIGGDVCHECYDITTGRSAKSQCLTCLNTGRERPFFDPIFFYVDYNPAAHVVQIAQFGEVQTKQRMCWFSAYPVLKPGDIIYQIGSGDLYRVSRIGPNSEPQGVTIMQVASLDTIDRNSVEYRGLPPKIPQSQVLQAMADWEEIRQLRSF